MAKDVASRVPGDDASAPGARERIERAAARFASIHDRWSALNADTRTLDTNSPAESLGDGAAPDGGEAKDAEFGPEGVRVTPILGVSSSDAAASPARPRFKTLMGVPRSSPDIDALAGFDLDPRRRRDTVRFERPTTPAPAPSHPPRAEDGTPEASDEPSLAATSWPWERSAPVPRQSPRAAPPQWAALVESSLDVSAEVAALRTLNGRRYWAAGVGTVAALVVLFAVGAPRERALALRWLHQEYQARVHPSVEAITDRARALRPMASIQVPASVGDSQTAAPLPAPAAATSADAVTSVSNSSGAAAPEPALGAAAAKDPSTAAGRAVTAGSSVEATGSMDKTSAREAGPSKASAATSSSDSGRPPSEASARSRATSPSNAAPSPNPVARDVRSAASTAADNNREPDHAAAGKTAGNTSKSRQPVAAPRKRSQHAAALAANATKARATHQNSPRKDAEGGIIRETPF